METNFLQVSNQGLDQVRDPELRVLRQVVDDLLADALAQNLPEQLAGYIDGLAGNDPSLDVRADDALHQVLAHDLLREILLDQIIIIIQCRFEPNFKYYQQLSYYNELVNVKYISTSMKNIINLISGKPQEIRAVMLGLDNSGKTKILIIGGSLNKPNYWVQF
ncbi:Hypothetical_protein [Hexamita inflata]|uniref:Hypothetical_protein n=1 Tax=Hexamita inflata TaxID=28002 RepID=A0AA86P3P9_9EUKA|nr:Hypothetical protein HINF_LOCUS17771 [Hexamita inflata]